MNEDIALPTLRNTSYSNVPPWSMTSEEALFPPSPALDYTWTSGNDSAFNHVRAIAAGGSGEVHEVSPTFKDFKVLI